MDNYYSNQPQSPTHQSTPQPPPHPHQQPHPQFQAQHQRQHSASTTSYTPSSVSQYPSSTVTATAHSTTHYTPSSTPPPPPPPPKPNSQEQSRHGTPQARHSSQTPAPGNRIGQDAQMRQAMMLAGVGSQFEDPNAQVHPQQQHHQQQQQQQGISPPRIEDGWLPDGIRDKSCVPLIPIHKFQVSY